MTHLVLPCINYDMPMLAKLLAPIEGYLVLRINFVINLNSIIYKVLIK